MSYFKKSHTHKPEKGKGSYNRDVVTDPREIEEAFRKDQEEEDELLQESRQLKPKLEKLKEVWPDEPGGALCGYIPEVDDRPLTDKYRGHNKCPANTTTVDGATHRKG